MAAGACWTACSSHVFYCASLGAHAHNENWAAYSGDNTEFFITIFNIYIYIYFFSVVLIYSRLGIAWYIHSRFIETMHRHVEPEETAVRASLLKLGQMKGDLYMYAL